VYRPGRGKTKTARREIRPKSSPGKWKCWIPAWMGVRAIMVEINSSPPRPPQLRHKRVLNNRAVHRSRRRLMTRMMIFHS
ncbi:uncharacterized protein METZ01_LOCUS474935, partial [marine metagenome]